MTVPATGIRHLLRHKSVSGVKMGGHVSHISHGMGSTSMRDFRNVHSPRSRRCPGRSAQGPCSTPLTIASLAPGSRQNTPHACKNIPASTNHFGPRLYHASNTIDDAQRRHGALHHELSVSWLTLDRCYLAVLTRARARETAPCDARAGCLCHTRPSPDSTVETPRSSLIDSPMSQLDMRVP